MATGLSFILAILAITFLIFFSCLIKLGVTLLLSISFLYASLIMSILSIASHPSINLPLLLCKNSNGSFPIWSTIIFSPYLFLTRWVTELMRSNSGQAPYSEVSEGLYVGGWPSSFEKLPPGEPAVVDCTNELPRKLEVVGRGYLCVPTWDSLSPDVVAIEYAVDWACRKRARNTPVFVHCAFGMNLRIGFETVVGSILLQRALQQDACQDSCKSLHI